MLYLAILCFGSAAVRASRVGWDLEKPGFYLMEIYRFAMVAEDLYRVDLYRVDVYRVDVYRVDLYRVDLYRVDVYRVDLLVD